MNFKSSLVTSLLSLCVFLITLISSNSYAEDLSIVNSNYLLQQGDVVMVSVWGEETMQIKDLRVLPDGNISFPLVGNITVAGKTTSQVSSEVAEKLKEFLPEPQVTVLVTGIEGNKAYILGKVTRPGPILLSSPTYVLQALSLAGVLDRFADKSAIKLIRVTPEGQQVIPLDYENLIKGKNLEKNILLKSGDTIVVP